VLDDRTIGITLMRGFRNDICTFSVTEFDHQVSELSQSLGDHEFTFRITSVDPGDGFAALYREHEMLSAPMTLCQTRAHAGTLPPVASLLSIDNEALVLSGIKKAARRDELILRLFNPSERAQQTTLRVSQGVEKAFLTNLNEEIESELAVTGNTVGLSFEPKKIVTVALKLK
jgi:mannosylglycerate hydrolase